MKSFSLLYHDVIAGNDFEQSGFAGAEAAIYKMTAVQFREHLEAIAATTTRPALVSELAQTYEPNRWMLHFDDGGSSGMTTISAMLRSVGWKAHFFITTDFVDSPQFLRKADIRALRAEGHIIGTHSCSHPERMSKLDRVSLLREWRDSRAMLSDLLGEDVAIGSVPGGFYNRRVAEAAAEAGVRILFNSEPVAAAKRVEDLLVLGRYSIDQRVPARAAAAIASGRVTPRLRQFVYWNAKKTAKVAMGRTYAAVRSHLLRQRAQTER